MEVAEFTLTLKGNPERVGRVLRAMQNEYQAILRESYALHESLYREFGLGAPRCTTLATGLEGTITLKKADIEALGWH